MSRQSERRNPLVAGEALLFPSAGPSGPSGPPGPPGEPGPASAGPVMWTGVGAPPDFVEGSKPGDTWLDTSTGDIYELGGES